MNPIAETLSTLTLGEAVSFRNLAFFPLLASEGRDPGYLTLDEALAERVARVTEVSAGGSVPELRFENGGAEKVLLVDGEELVGAKQNRVLNVTILVGAQQTVTIPVSCVEQGRWSYRSPEFASAGRAQFSKGRAEKAEQVSYCLRATGERRSDQGAVWEGIAEMICRLDADSPTGAMADIYEKSASSLGEYRDALRPLQRQAGAVFAVGRKIVGVDLFDSPATLGKLWGKLLSSYALDALEEATGGSAAGNGGAGREAAERFLRHVGEATVNRFPGVGIGEDLRLQRSGLAGGGLWAEGRLVHLAAFRVGNGNGDTAGDPRMARASRRRAYRM